MAAKTEKGSEVKDFTTDPIDSDKVLGFKNSDGTRWWSLSRFWDWIKSKTASTITAGDKTPVNSDAVNGALTNFQKKARLIVTNGAEPIWIKITGINLTLYTRHGETLELKKLLEASAVRSYTGFAKFTDVFYEDGYWYIRVEQWADGVWAKNEEGFDFEVSILSSVSVDLSSRINITSLAYTTDLLKEKIINVGDIQVATSGPNYALLYEEENIKIVSVQLAYWSDNTGVFSIFVYLDKMVYLIANKGFSVKNLQIKLYYL